MATHFLFILARLSLLCPLVFSVVAARPNPPCLSPKVRREWRQLSKYEREDWIRAVNVLAYANRPQSCVDSRLSVSWRFAARPETAAHFPFGNHPDTSRFKREFFLRWYVSPRHILSPTRLIWGIVDIVYVHMDLNLNVRLPSALPVLSFR